MMINILVYEREKILWEDTGCDKRFRVKNIWADVIDLKEKQKKKIIYLNLSAKYRLYKYTTNRSWYGFYKGLFVVYLSTARLSDFWLKNCFYQPHHKINNNSNIINSNNDIKTVRLLE